MKEVSPYSLWVYSHVLMNYISSRGMSKGVKSAEAIVQGIAPDGGLFVPEQIPKITLENMINMVEVDYPKRAFDILSLYLTEFSEEELKSCISSAYSTDNFDSPHIAPITKLSSTAYILELWHGPTCAFKDMALQILPHLMVKAIKKTGEDKEVVVLVATSGDTGKAALEGFRDVPGTKIIVFYPDQGVSHIQEWQMVTQEGKNVGVVAVQGNFDHAQAGVKEIFASNEINSRLNEKNMRLSSANSINWGRLVPQIAYYISAYVDMIKQGVIDGGECVNIVVPTGNFGNILAAYYGKQMGLPVNKLICASNVNNVLAEFINTGIYDINRDFYKTISPSMDILISSNLERLLFELSGHDWEKINNWMESLKEKGKYSVGNTISDKLNELFWADFSYEDDTLEAIRKVYAKYNYVVDPHTAVGIRVYESYKEATGDKTKTIIASTASPYKFNKSVVKAICGQEAVEGNSDFQLLTVLKDLSRTDIPRGLEGIEEKTVIHKKKCSVDNMKDVVMELLGS